MTTVQVWAGVDARGVASLNVVSDSRISWDGAQHWDFGRKVFYCQRHPHVFAYWGHVLFPALALTQITDQIDQGVTTGTGPEQWRNVITEQLSLMVRGFPATEEFTIVHLGRHGVGMTSTFYVQTFQYKPRLARWDVRDLSMPTQSGVVIRGGSGAQPIKEFDKERAGRVGEGTSRAAYITFVEWLNSQSDPSTGGAPQLCRLIRIGAAEPVGVIHNRGRFFMGAPVPHVDASQRANWHNDLFEIADVQTRKRAEGAQRHT
ncbi:hypothetical protein [Propionicimonas sp.]|uniref:hypothetical protein n=1 Tax=Propionicimonas sp. TaxID=1955623 RepID=UPI0017F7B3E6|nr:hypothetical protein [Propionicimonas sp.]MBU3977810.1 hypothetical protein [Actinomycetota bacterium]MBA3021732.1 hypothetical protein [Propionicimonas sp.]MBU3987284.1 hypothetical protein [Actinomycetota bacterium]MBU4009105.1 hypothetical protein [Actinomycetota bacterium]MBU4065745.1 hypothetical protein [Actinomycetota bacterium]